MFRSALMLLCLSSEYFSGVGVCFGFDEVVDLADDVAFEAADDIAFGFTFLGSSSDVIDGGLVESHATDDDAVDCGV